MSYVGKFVNGFEVNVKIIIANILISVKMFVLSIAFTLHWELGSSYLLW